MIYGQQQSNSDPEQLIEKLFAFQENDVNYEEQYEQLLLYFYHPLDLNKAQKEELLSLYVLSDFQVQQFLNYRNQFGKLMSIYELQVIDGFDYATIQKMLPFVTVSENEKGNKNLVQRMFSENNNYLLLRYERTLEKKKGYHTPLLKPGEDPPTRYLGSSGKHYARFRVSYPNDFSLGFTAEKDAGEAYLWDPEQRAFGSDFYSYHFQIKNNHNLENLIIGDYKIQYGQSLLLGAGFTVGKGAETINTVRRVNLGARPYTSVVETNFFRGITATYQITKSLQFTPFYSNLRQDAIIKKDSSSEFISTVQQSGFHRTPSQLAAKNTVREKTYGGTLLFTNEINNLQVGATFINTSFNFPIRKRDAPYNQYEFSGDVNHNAGMFFNYTWQNVSLFGETARSKSGGIGAVGGMIISLSPQLETSVVLRSYDKNFHAFQGQAFGESTRNINERGWYWGIKFKPDRKYEFTAYFDQFTYPWLTSRINSPSRGYEFLLRGSYQPFRNTHVYLQYRQQSKMTNPSGQDTA
ncbi:MAG: helix-hairpin-helix domain-containing protein, partial [Fulvivirga sp.]|nr:helix-hairpin-helix domain-containing protein [Fulvivirga sp.]